MAGEVHHPVFARINALLSRREPPEVREHRRRLLSGLSGRVLEIGPGTGVNFQFYPATVTEVVALEPEPSLRDQAIRAADAAPVPVVVDDAIAEHVPLEDGVCDAAVVALVLCSIADVPRALAEIHRVLRPGGELRFYEHVLSRKPSIARSQRCVDRTFWPRAFGGCHTSRDTVSMIAAAGFAIDEDERLWAPPCALAIPVGTHALGRAHRP